MKKGLVLSTLMLGFITLALALGHGYVSAATVFSDGFESGSSKWTTSGGSWSVASDGTNVFKQSSTSSDTYAYAGSSSWANYSVQARMKVLAFNGSDRPISLTARFIDSNNFYFVRLSNNNTLSIRKKVGGSTKSLASKSFQVSAGTWYTVKLVLNGSKLTCYVDDVQQLTVTDTAISAGKIGVNMVKCSGEIDNVLVDDNTATPTATNSPSVTVTKTPTVTATKTPALTTTPVVTATPTATATTTPITGTAYYVATTGSDSNTGTSLTSPLASITKAISKVAAGDIIYVRGGTYYPTSVVTLSSSGTSAKPYRIFAYSSEKPIFDFKAQGSGISTYGFYVTGNYWHLKGLEIKNAAGKGVRITGSYNTFEQIVSHDNHDSGFYVGTNKTTTNDGTLAAYNTFKNCDSYLNYDAGGSTGDGGNADGFSCKLHPGKGNTFYGCRAWENSDDGWDLYMADYAVTIENCWTWRNGDPKSVGYTGSNWAGNGSGFKMGGGSSTGAHIVKNCVAFDINYGVNTNKKAFDQNGSSGALTGVTMYNCLAFNSMWGFYFAAAPTTGNHTFKNCVAFGNSSGDKNLYSAAVQANNTWNLSITATSSDFLSLATSYAEAARQSDGSLPTTFGRLTSGSQLIDKGVNVGTAYKGSAPDLGAYECY